MLPPAIHFLAFLCGICVSVAEGSTLLSLSNLKCLSAMFSGGESSTKEHDCTVKLKLKRTSKEEAVFVLHLKSRRASFQGAQRPLEGAIYS